MIECHLHGSLKARFGGPFSLAVRDTAEAVRALCAQLTGFRDALTQGQWQVVRGNVETGTALDEQALGLALGHADALHLMPAIEGAGSDGVGKVLAGAALIGASFLVPGAGAFGAGIITQGAVAGLGVSLALGGVSMMLAPSPQSNFNERERPDQRPSFLFDGPVNTSTQGLPMPVIYGRMKTGSIVISAGMTAEELDA